jgi:hypothetical protein
MAERAEAGRGRSAADARSRLIGVGFTDLAGACAYGTRSVVICARLGGCGG